MLKYGTKVITKDLITISNSEGEYVEILKNTNLKCVGNENIKTAMILVTDGKTIAYIKSSRLHEIKKR